MRAVIKDEGTWDKANWRGNWAKCVKWQRRSLMPPRKGTTSKMKLEVTYQKG